MYCFDLNDFLRPQVPKVNWELYEKLLSIFASNLHFFPFSVSVLPGVVSERSSVGLTLLKLQLDAPVKATFSSKSLSPLLLCTSSYPFSGFSFMCGHFIK